MPIHLELITAKVVWKLRAGPGMGQLGDAYQATAVVEEISPGVVKVVALSGQLYRGFRTRPRKWVSNG